MPAQPLESPPVVPWSAWYEQQPYEKQQGQHVLFSGPTQSGKTVLCRLLLRIRKAVVVVGTKVVDPSLDDYLTEGYTRIHQWPPTKADWRRNNRYGDGDARFILWPKIRKREDLRSPELRATLGKMFDEVFIEGRWTVAVDEGLWIASPSGLGLSRHLGDTAYGAASNKVSLYVSVQRIANVPPVVWTSCSWAEVFKSGRTDDLRELSSLGTYEPKDTALAIRHLRGHQFLDLPVRGGAKWAVTEVDESWV